MRDLVVKDNALINASYSLDLVEQRLILLAIVEARESGRGISATGPLHVHAESYALHFGVARQTAYQALKDACKDLFARQFSYQELSPKGRVITHLSRWVSQISYLDDGGTVSLIFAPAIIPLITRLEQHFTSYELEQVSGLSTAYAVRLYELLIAWRSTGKTPVFELADFRQKMGVLESEYGRMHDFKKRVLDPALEQVSTHTDIVVKCEQHKTGRTISGFSFRFKQKPKPKVEKPVDPRRDPNTPDFFIDMTDSQRYLFAHKLSQLQEMSSYSEGTESYEDFAKRIAEWLLDPDRFRTFYPLLVKVGFGSR